MQAHQNLQPTEVEPINQLPMKSKIQLNTRPPLKAMCVKFENMVMPYHGARSGRYKCHEFGVNVQWVTTEI